MTGFFIVIPTRNSADVLDRCLASIFLTKGANSGLRVHIQDGGSEDDTITIARKWTGHGVTVASEPDNGLYDAIDKATRELAAGGTATGFNTIDETGVNGLTTSTFNGGARGAGANGGAGGAGGNSGNGGNGTAPGGGGGGGSGGNKSGGVGASGQAVFTVN